MPVAAQSEPLVVAAPPVVAVQEPAVTVEPPASPASIPKESKPVERPVKAPAKASAPVAASPQPAMKAAPPTVASVQAPLDVASLIARLRETEAIGVMTKLALKNQVDDLLKKFRAHHQGGQKTSVAELRQPYNMLVLKVLSLVQDGDPALARSISSSREAIWGILADREKFASVS